LEDESNRYFVLWIDRSVGQLKSDVASYLTDGFGLQSVAEWESTEISEESEDGTQVAILSTAVSAERFNFPES
jgi:hypothetical protein